MFKKITCLSCLLIVMSTGFQKTYASSYTQYTQPNYKIEWLIENKIVEGRETNLELDKTITRAEVAKLLVLLDNSTIKEKSINTFTDVPENHWAKKYIEKCNANGFIVGFPDGSFKPEKEISYYEVIAMLSRSNANWKKDLENNATWPTTYFNFAQDNKFLENIDINSLDLKSGGLRQIVFEIFYNAFNKDIKKIDNTLSSLSNNKISNSKNNFKSSSSSSSKSNSSNRPTSSISSSDNYKTSDNKGAHSTTVVPVNSKLKLLINTANKLLIKYDPSEIEDGEDKDVLIGVYLSGTQKAKLYSALKETTNKAQAEFDLKNKDTKQIEEQLEKDISKFKNYFTDLKEQVEITFNANGGTFINSEEEENPFLNAKVIKYNVGEKIGYIEEPEKENHKLIGWTLNGNDFDMESEINSNIVLYAKWEIKKEHTIIFDNEKNFEIGSMYSDDSAQRIFNGEKLTTLPKVTPKDGYKFVGWIDELKNIYTSEELLNKTIESSMRIEPIWEVNNVNEKDDNSINDLYKLIETYETMQFDTYRDQIYEQIELIKDENIKNKILNKIAETETEVYFNIVKSDLDDLPYPYIKDKFRNRATNSINLLKNSEEIKKLNYKIEIIDATYDIREVALELFNVARKDRVVNELNEDTALAKVQDITNPFLTKNVIAKYEIQKVETQNNNIKCVVVNVNLSKDSGEEENIRMFVERPSENVAMEAVNAYESIGTDLNSSEEDKENAKDIAITRLTFIEEDDIRESLTKRVAEVAVSYYEKISNNENASTNDKILARNRAKEVIKKVFINFEDEKPYMERVVKINL